MLLTYMRQYFELFVTFQRRDAGFDGWLSLGDYKHGLDQLAKFGAHVPYAEVEDAFDAIDVDRAGTISFGARTRTHCSPPARQTWVLPAPYSLPSVASSLSCTSRAYLVHAHTHILLSQSPAEWPHPRLLSIARLLSTRARRRLLRLGHPKESRPRGW